MTANAAVPPGWFVFEHPRDDFGPSALDCSRFIEAPTGRHGFVTVRDGRFAFQDGTAARFWGAQMNPYAKDEIDYCVRRMRKQGINITRNHGLGYLNRDQDGSILQYDPQGLAKLDYLLYRLGQEGIYMILDVDYYLPVKPGDNVPGLEAGGKTPFLMFFNDPIAAIKRQRMEDVLTRVNPYNGLRYCDDPTLALVEVCNEDSLFWHGVDRLAEPFKSQLARRFKAWLRQRYGDEAGLRRAWTVGDGCALEAGEGLADDAPLAMLAMWEYDEKWLVRHPHKAPRGQDQLRFFLELERKYFLDSRDHMRGFGVKVPICGTCWKGGGFSTRVHMRGQADLDYVDRHGYWDHPQGEGNLKWRIQSCTFTNLPMVKAVTAGEDPAQENNVGNLVLRTAWERVLGKPTSVSEWNTCLPNEYSLEGTGLMAAYGLLQGWDAPLQFGYFSPDWPEALGPNSFDMLGNPPQLLQYPAVTTMWHRQDVREGELVAEVLYDDSSDGLFEMAEDRRSLPLMAACVGKVGYRFTEQTRPAVVKDIRPWWDPATLTARSTTGELSWNASAGVVTIDTPATQGVIGFLSAGPYAMGSAELTSANRFGAVYVTSLADGEPIDRAPRLLVSAIGPARNTGMEYGLTDREDKTHNVRLARLPDPGQAPALLEAIQGELRIRNAHAGRLRAWVLDVNGRRLREKPLHADGQEVVLRLDADDRTVYYELADE